MEEEAITSAKMVSPIVWHRYLGHMNKHELQLLLNKEFLSGYKSLV